MNRPIPKYYSSYKIPTGIQIKSRSMLKNYSTFCLLKIVNPEGRLRITSLSSGKGDKDFYKRALANMESLGWATKRGSHYHLKSYQHVWRHLEVKPFFLKKKKLNKITYTVINADELPRKRSARLKAIRSSIERVVCDRKYNQIKYRLNTQIAPRGSKRARRAKLLSAMKPVSLSSETAATLLGYKANSSGHKARRKYFRMKRRKSKLLSYLNPKGHRIYRYECGQLSF